MKEKTLERSWNTDAFRRLVERYHADPVYRRRVEADPVTAFAEKGIDLPAGIEFRVVANTDERIYVPLPADPSLTLGDEALAAIAGGKTVGTASSISSTGTFLCASVASTASTINTVSSLGSA